MSDLYGEDITVATRDRWCRLCGRHPHETRVPYGPTRGHIDVCGWCEAGFLDNHKHPQHTCARLGCDR